MLTAASPKMGFQEKLYYQVLNSFKSAQPTDASRGSIHTSQGQDQLLLNLQHSGSAFEPA